MDIILVLSLVFISIVMSAVMLSTILCTVAGGEYCGGDGLALPSGLCDAGYYCSGASPTATPAQGSAYGGNCVAGEFCPEGSSVQTPCTPGHYCAVDFMNDTSGECDPGYYCTISALVSNPTDGNVTGELVKVLHLI